MTTLLAILTIQTTATFPSEVAAALHASTQEVYPHDADPAWVDTRQATPLDDPALHTLLSAALVGLEGMDPSPAVDAAWAAAVALIQAAADL